MIVFLHLYSIIGYLSFNPEPVDYTHKQKPAIIFDILYYTKMQNFGNNLI